jgi:hypothetical protein
MFCDFVEEERSVNPLANQTPLHIGHNDNDGVDISSLCQACEFFQSQGR